MLALVQDLVYTYLYYQRFKKTSISSAVWCLDVPLGNAIFSPSGSIYIFNLLSKKDHEIKVQTIFSLLNM